jgi:hypothetical protein
MGKYSLWDDFTDGGHAGTNLRNVALLSWEILLGSLRYDNFAGEGHARPPLAI